MSRKTSARRSLPVPELHERADADRHALTGKLELVTPLFGGGVRVESDEQRRQLKEPDRVTPVRSAALRGALRAWWRRTCGYDEAGRPLPLEALRAREAILWGWASTQQQPARGWVGVQVDCSNLQLRPYAVLEKNHRDRWQPRSGLGDGIRYAIFPLQPRNNDGHLPAGQLTTCVGTFSVALRGGLLSDQQRQRAAEAWGADVGGIEDRLWREVKRAWLAWSTFGGLGGRSRRGFGAVRLVDPAPPGVEAVLEQLGWADRCALLPKPFDKGDQAHEAALAQLQKLRQGIGMGRNPGQQRNRPGRSRWPEPDELRRLTDKHDGQHEPEHPVHKFPRAAFGMPIIFHFQSNADPADQALQPRGAERLASPLLLRPVWDGAKYRAMALLLPTRDDLDRLLDDLELRSTTHRVSGRVSPDEQARIRPLGDPSTAGGDAVLRSFLRFFRG